MTDITAEAQFDNFFALFEQPVQFEVNQESLDQHLRLLQNVITLIMSPRIWKTPYKRNNNLSKLQR